MKEKQRGKPGWVEVIAFLIMAGGTTGAMLLRVHIPGVSPLGAELFWVMGCACIVILQCSVAIILTMRYMTTRIVEKIEGMKNG